MGEGDAVCWCPPVVSHQQQAEILALGDRQIAESAVLDYRDSVRLFLTPCKCTRRIRPCRIEGPISSLKDPPGKYRFQMSKARLRLLWQLSSLFVFTYNSEDQMLCVSMMRLGLLMMLRTCPQSSSPHQLLVLLLQIRPGHLLQEI